MNGKQIKRERAQLRNVVQREIPTLVKSETMIAATKEMAEVINTRLDQIAQATEKEVKKIDTQSQTFRGYAMRELGMQLTQELGNISVTMMAWQEVLTKRLGITDLTTFDAEVAAAKVDIQNRLQAEAQLKADAEAAAEMQAREAAKAAKAEENARAALSTFFSGYEAPVQDALASKESEPAQG